MCISKEGREDFERRVNGYIMRIIKNQYIRHVKYNKFREVSLNELNKDGVELIELVAGDDNVYLKDEFDVFASKGNKVLNYNELEMVFEDDCIYNAVKSLTDKEKLAIFLCKVKIL